MQEPIEGSWSTSLHCPGRGDRGDGAERGDRGDRGDIEDRERVHDYQRARHEDETLKALNPKSSTLRLRSPKPHNP